MRFARSIIRPTGLSLIALALLTYSHNSMAGPVGGVTAAQQVAEKNTPTKSFAEVKRPSGMDIAIDKSVPITFNRPAATVFIANPEIADVQVLSATSVMVFGKKAGQTTLIITDDFGKKVVYRSIVVTQNLSDLQRAIRTVLPGSKIKVKSVPNGIVLTGRAKDTAAIEDARRLASRYLPEQGGEIINRIQVAANNQIQINVRFAEVSKDVDKRFGINWDTVGRLGSTAIGFGVGPDFYTAANAMTRTTVGDSLNGGLFGHYDNSNLNLNVMLDALSKDGFVTILAEPTLTALSGQTASFLAGGEFPVPVPQSEDTISIEWKQYGVSLAFTPTIISGDRINLHVRPEVSQLSDVGSITLSNIAVPALITRRAETTVELNSGQSFALAGLLNNQQTQSVEKFPFLGDIPVLGPLFRSTRFQNEESELVIIITPHLVKPSTEEELSLPTDGYITPTDEEFFLGMKNVSKMKDARKLSGDPRAVVVKNPKSEGKAKALKAPPTPKKAPKAKVEAVPLPKKKPIIRKRAKIAEPKVKAPKVKALTKTYPMSKAAPKAPAKPAEEKAGELNGPGGFIVE